METSLSTIEIFSLISSIASIILAVVAIVLSILFYRWSETANKDSQKAALGIENNTKKIEALFDKFYSDTFGLMKSNYEAMQSKFLGPPISSGDSSQTDQEQLETIISSIMLRIKISTLEGIVHSIENSRSVKKCNHEEISLAIKSLEAKGVIFLKDNLISIASHKSNQDEGSNS